MRKKDGIYVCGRGRKALQNYVEREKRTVIIISKHIIITWPLCDFVRRKIKNSISRFVDFWESRLMLELLSYLYNINVI